LVQEVGTDNPHSTVVKKHLIGYRRSLEKPEQKPDVVHYSTLITADGENDPAAVRKVQADFSRNEGG
jgi:hypothetical protein